MCYSHRYTLLVPFFELGWFTGLLLLLVEVRYSSSQLITFYYIERLL